MPSIAELGARAKAASRVLATASTAEPARKAAAKKKPAKKAKAKAANGPAGVHWTPAEWRLYEAQKSQGATHAQARAAVKAAHKPKRRKKAPKVGTALSLNTNEKIPVMRAGSPGIREGSLVTGQARDNALYSRLSQATDDPTRRIIRRVLSKSRKPPAVVLPGPRGPRAPKPLGLPSGMYKPKTPKRSL